MEFEPITFGSGINLKKSPLLLKDGELVSCEGFSYDNDGVMTARDSVQTVNIATLGSIHSIHRILNLVVAGSEGNIYYKWDLDGYCDNYTPPNGNFTYLGSLASQNRWRVADYAGFTFIATGNDMYAFLNGYFFNCSSITSPTIPPAVSSSGGSGTAADHTWYYTYVYRFTNGHQYESGLSPGKTITSNPTGDTATIKAFNSTMYPFELSAVTGEDNGNDIYTKLLIHSEGVDESVSMADSSGSAHTINVNGNAQIDTSQYKFGASSLLLAGASDYIYVSDHDDFKFGTGDFTIDCWIRVDEAGNYLNFPAATATGLYFWKFSYELDGGVPKITFTNSDSVVTIQYKYTITLAVDTWYHVAFVRNGSTGYIFVNGNKNASTEVMACGSKSMLPYATNPQIGPPSATSQVWIDEFRISKGIARWTNNFTVPSAAYSENTYSTGQANALDGVDIFWKAYKTSDIIGDIYECYNGIDKYALSATETYTDSTVLDNAICTTSNYGNWPLGIIDVCTHLQRIFGIKDNKLYYSEPYLPFALDSINVIAVTSDGNNLTSVVSLGNQLFVSSASTWYKLVGTSDATWAIVDSFSDAGSINRHTVKKTLQGIVGLYYDGIYLFDGYRSRNITDAKIGHDFFDDISSKESCYAEFHNNRYYFYYPTTGTTCNKCLIIDFTYYPELKYYHDNFVPNCFEYHVPTGIRYYGDTDGYQYESGGTEVIPTFLQTGDKSLKNVLQRKQLQYLYYDINTGGKDVTVSIYVDGTNSYSFTLNESTRLRSRKLLPKLEGHRFSVYLSCADSSGLYIYEPWGFGYSFAGE